MSEMTGYCGFKCSQCMIFRDNLKGIKDREKFRDGLLKYYGDKLTLEECYCDGCMTPDSKNPVLITFDCKVRPCAIKKGVKNCVYCEQYPCEMVAKKPVDYQKVKDRFSASLPEEDYQLFVMPYECKEMKDKGKRKKK